MKSERQKSALTMIEILIVVAILAIMASGMFVVSSKVRQQAQVKSVRGTLAMLDAALEQYYDFDKSYPPDVNYAGAGYTRDIQSAVKLQPADTIVGPYISPPAAGYDVSDYDDAYSVAVLYYYLNRVPQSRLVLKNLADAAVSAKAVKFDSQGKPIQSRMQDPNALITVNVQSISLFRIVDSWNMPLHYIRKANDDKNFPLIRSAGPDKVFGTEDDIVNKKN
jgi:prepilin-type N-terminal cleavage/methylation domain-containing protein